MVLAVHGRKPRVLLNRMAASQPRPARIASRGIVVEESRKGALPFGDPLAASGDPLSCPYGRVLTAHAGASPSLVVGGNFRQHRRYSPYKLVRLQVTCLPYGYFRVVRSSYSIVPCHKGPSIIGCASRATDSMVVVSLVSA